MWPKPVRYERPNIPAVDDELVIGDIVSRIVSVTVAKNPEHPNISVYHMRLCKSDGEEWEILALPNELDWFGSRWLLHPRGYRVSIDSSRETSLLGKWVDSHRFQVTDPDTQIVRYIEAASAGGAVDWARELLGSLEQPVPDTFNVAPIHKARLELATRKIVEGALYDFSCLMSGDTNILENLPLGSDMRLSYQGRHEDTIARLSDDVAVETFARKMNAAWRELVGDSLSWRVEGLADAYCGACSSPLFECSCDR